MKELIKAEHLSYAYPSDEEGVPPHQALKDVSFTINEGEFVAIL